MRSTFQMFGHPSIFNSKFRFYRSTDGQLRGHTYPGQWVTARRQRVLTCKGNITICIVIFNRPSRCDFRDCYCFNLIIGNHATTGVIIFISVSARAYLIRLDVLFDVAEIKPGIGRWGSGGQSYSVGTICQWWGWQAAARSVGVRRMVGGCQARKGNCFRCFPLMEFQRRGSLVHMFVAYGNRDAVATRLAVMLSRWWLLTCQFDVGTCLFKFVMMLLNRANIIMTPLLN